MNTVAVFDLDGTITRRDTLLPFLRRARGLWPTSSALLVESLAITRAMLGAAGRDGAKERLLVRLLAGHDAATLALAADAYAEVVVRSGLRRDVAARVAQHRERGDAVIIISASPELYVAPIGRNLGVDAVLGTRLEVGADGRLTGRYEGRNCRGPEKVMRLRAWMHERFGDEQVQVFAYGDSAGDNELLAMADVPVRIARRQPLRALGG